MCRNIKTLFNFEPPATDEEINAASPGCRSSRATDGKTLMTMVQRGFPSAELRDEHRAGLPNAFARLEQVIEERVSPLKQADSS
jgi:Uncharacterized conserved protein (DUF2277)